MFWKKSPKETTTATQADIEISAGSHDLKPRQVKVMYDGEEFEFTVNPDKSILETALSMGIDLPHSCQSGMCTACMGRCTSGKVMLSEEGALTAKELEQGYVLTCVGHPLTDNVVVEID